MITSSVPVLGDLPGFWTDSIATLVRSNRKQGDAATVDLAGRRFALLSKPEHVRQVLQTNAGNYARGYDANSTMFGTGLLSSEGDLWKSRRRMLAPAFHRLMLPTFSEAVVEETKREMERWEISGSGALLDVSGSMTRLMGRIVLRFVFGSDPAATGGILGDKLVSIFDEAFADLDLQMVAPFAKRWPLPSNYRLKRSIAALDRVVMAEIQRRRKNGRTGEDFLGMVLDARDPKTGRPLSDREARDEVVSIYGAGHETTATALSWCIYALSRYPGAAQRVREEADLLGTDGEISAVQLPDLVESRAFVNEVLRLYPPVWLITRTATGPDVVAEHELQPGSLVMVSSFLTHRRPEYWENPEGFDPGRFRTRSKPENTERHPYAYYPFGGGRHMCIGRHFALAAATLAVATMNGRYRLDLAAGEEVRVGAKGRVRVSLKPHPRLWVRRVPRCRGITKAVLPRGMRAKG